VRRGKEEERCGERGRDRKSYHDSIRFGFRLDLDLDLDLDWIFTLGIEIGKRRDGYNTIRYKGERGVSHALSQRARSEESTDIRCLVLYWAAQYRTVRKCRSESEGESEGESEVSRHLLLGGKIRTR
jgi:hypothetical protein